MAEKKFELLEKKMCKELQSLEDKYVSGGKCRQQNLRRSICWHMR